MGEHYEVWGGVFSGGRDISEGSGFQIRDGSRVRFWLAEWVRVGLYVCLFRGCLGWCSISGLLLESVLLERRALCLCTF